MFLRSVGRYIARHHLGLIALFIALGGTSYAVTRSAGSNEIRACVNNATGSIRVQKGKRCGRGERKLVWNKTGVTGKTGPTGPVGPPAPVVSLEPWHLVGAMGEPLFSGNWKAVASSPLGFRKDANGQVFFKGAASNATGWSGSVFTLPPGFRPPAEVNLATATASIPAKMRIEPNGEVVPMGGGVPPLNLAYFDGVFLFTD